MKVQGWEEKGLQEREIIGGFGDDVIQVHLLFKVRDRVKSVEIKRRSGRNLGNLEWIRIGWKI